MFDAHAAGGARILGVSERRVLPTNVLLVFDGNNLSFHGDINRRVVKCRLDAELEQPELRAFDFDCHVEVSATRSALIIAGLTLLRAFTSPDAPSPSKRMGDLRIMTGCGVPSCGRSADPATTCGDVVALDTKKDELVRVMDLWEIAAGTRKNKSPNSRRKARRSSGPAPPRQTP